METKTRTLSETEALFADLDKPSLHALSYALRHPDTWPEAFVWNYAKCDHCAMGLAHQLWATIPSVNRTNGASFMARSFAIPFEDARSIFLGSEGQFAAAWLPKKRTGFWFRPGYVSDFQSVTPEMVADQIDKYL